MSASYEDDLEFINVNYDDDPKNGDECYIQVPEDPSKLKHYKYIVNNWMFQGLVSAEDITNGNIDDNENDVDSMKSGKSSSSNRNINNAKTTNKNNSLNINDVDDECETEKEKAIKLKDLKQLLSLLKKKDYGNAIGMLETLIANSKKCRKPNPYNQFISVYMKKLKAEKPELNTHQRLAHAVEAWKTQQHH